MLKPYGLLTCANQKEHPCVERFSRRQTEILREFWKGKQNKTNRVSPLHVRERRGCAYSPDHEEAECE
jgi:hypothetical protein